jgi:hypothetical protein
MKIISAFLGKTAWIQDIPLQRFRIKEWGARTFCANCHIADLSCLHDLSLWVNTKSFHGVSDCEIQAWFLSLVNMPCLFGGLSLFFTGGLLLFFKDFCESEIRESVFLRLLLDFNIYISFFTWTFELPLGRVFFDELRNAHDSTGQSSTTGYFVNRVIHL